MKDTTSNILAGCLTSIILLVFGPVLSFACGYFGGLMLKWFVGDILVSGLNIVFNTTRFTTNLIPIVCGALATIGRYFKTSVTTSSS